MITIRRAVFKQCPFKDETDAGELVITLPGDAPELHELGRSVDLLCSSPVSHEDFTRAVLLLLPDDASVTTRWQTGAWTIEVSEGSAVLRESVGGTRA
jgi:hypothetical protein